MIKNKNTEHAQVLACQNCWICEGWSELYFSIWKVVSLQHIADPVFIHFEFDNWEPGIMTLKSGTKDVWECYWWVPPGKHKYFYSVEGHAGFAKDQKWVHLKEPLHINVKFKIQDDYL